jgi:hypothetical protein
MQKIMDRDFLAGLVLLFVGTVAFFKSGSDPMNWVFPHLATYLILAVAAVLITRVVFAAAVNHVPDVISMSSEDRTAFVDVFLFLLIVLGFLFVMYEVGFWIAGLLMLTLTSIHLTQERTRHNIMLILVVPIAASVVAYAIFQHLFYVPLPEPIWWANMVRGLWALIGM